MKRRNILAKLTLIIVGLFYALPMFSMARFAFQRVPVALLGSHNLFDRWTIKPLFTMFGKEQFRESASLSVRLALLSAAVTLIVLVPTVVYVHVSMMKARALIEVISILPFVVPALALVVGISGAFRESARRPPSRLRALRATLWSPSATRRASHRRSSTNRWWR